LLLAGSRDPKLDLEHIAPFSARAPKARVSFVSIAACPADLY
jgi:hypothetical protein